MAVRVERLTFASAGGATLADHAAQRALALTIVEVAASGFEAPSPAASAPVTARLGMVDATAGAEGLVSAARAAIAEVDEEAVGWLTRVRFHLGDATPRAVIEWIGGIEVHHVRDGQTLASTRGHRLSLPGAPAVVTRGIGAGHADETLDGPVRWELAAGDRVVIVSTALAPSLDAMAVARAVTGADAAAVLAAGGDRGFALAIELG